MANIVASGQITLVDLNDAKSLTAYIQSNQPKIQIRNGDTNALTPDWTSSNVILTPELFVSGTATNIINEAKSIVWYEAGNPTPIAAGSGYAIGATNPKALTISQNKLSAGTPQKTYIVEIVWTDTDTGVDVPIKAEIEFAQIASGAKGNAGVNAITVVVSNDSHSIPTDSAGNNPVYTGSGTEIHVYEGATELTYDGTGTANGTYTVTSVATAITRGTLTDSGVFLTVGQHSAITADTANITYTIAGKRADGTAFSVIKAQTFNKTKNGASGSTPTLYRLIPSANAIQQNISNVYNPTTLTVKGTSAVGSATPTDYATRFIISESTDGTTFVDKYTSSANEAAAGKTYTPSATNVKSIRVRMYIAGTGAPVHGTTQMLDEQVIPVVKDGATGAAGAAAVTAYVWTPNGSTIKNGSGTLTAQADLYVGSTKQTSGVTYLWYKFVSGVWTALTSAYTGYNTATLTITADKIESASSFKCVMTYASKTYEDVVTVADQTDPIQAVPISAEGTVFKNGVGTKNVTGKLYQSGAEIDVAGTIYDYKWFMRDEAGAIDPNFGGVGINSMTGKTIVVDSAKVTNIGNLVLEVWTK